METIWQDVRFGLRMLIKHRIATIVCVVALGLGIGATRRCSAWQSVSATSGAV